MRGNVDQIVVERLLAGRPVESNQDEQTAARHLREHGWTDCQIAVLLHTNQQTVGKLLDGAA